MISRSLRLNKIAMIRRFSTAAADEYTSIKQDTFYTPVHKVDFSNRQMVVFDGENTKERKFVPWEVKEAGIKAGVVIIGTQMAALIF